MPRLFLTLCLCLASAQLMATERLTWLLLSLPGVVNLQQNRPVDGLVFDFLRELEPGLDGLQIQYEVGNLARVQRDLERGVRLCAGPLLRSEERDQSAYFVPLLPVPEIHVVLRADDLWKLPLEEGRVLLPSLLDSPLRGAMMPQRRYTPIVQEQIQQGLASGKLLSLAVSGSQNKHLLMLNRGRFDYTLEYSPVVRQHNSDHPGERALISVPISSLALTELAGAYCSGGAWGRDMALRLDRALRTRLDQGLDVLPIYRRWLSAQAYAEIEGQLLPFFQERRQQQLQLPE